MNPLLELLEHGQSYWLDNLTREMIRGGELKRRVTEEGLRGVTSNPAIFDKAISRTEDYDEQIEHLARDDRSLESLYEEIAVTDIREACDILRPVYDESDGADGYVSLEVSPHLAHDTEGSLQEARRLYAAVDRPNVFIKIPGTPAGIPAIEEALYEGININITLLFSIESYEAVALAYLRALERRAEEDRPVDDVASVASFFLSRIDVLTDELLGHRIRPRRDAREGAQPESLLGRAAIANAKLAYESFLEIIGSERWKALERRGARPQRMLWASTSTKDPLYRDVKYVEPLIGPHTVNTLPERTIAAFADHGRVRTTVTDGMEEAREVLDALEAVGIDFDQVTAHLLHEGVRKFIAPYDRLMATLGRMRSDVLEFEAVRVEIDAGDVEKDVDAALTGLDQRRFGRRLAEGDAGLWTDDPDEAEAIRRRLGWQEAPARFSERTRELAAFVEEVRADGIERVVLLGMGGSSLAAEALGAIYGRREDHPRLHVLDDTAPAAIRAVDEAIDPARTLFVVASKSGTTIETRSLYRHFFERVREAVGAEAPARFVAITDPGSPLAEEARERGFRQVFENPPEIGGRYSALSWFGLVPAALAGIDVETLLEEGRAMVRRCDPALPAAADPAVRLGAVLGMAARKGRNKVTFFAGDDLAPFAAWAEQLLAESLGKRGLGVVPVLGESPGGPEAYGKDRLFVHLRSPGPEEPEVERTVGALRDAGHPVLAFLIPARGALGGEFFRWEKAVATAGAILGVNPFDEPNVTESKENTRRLLEERAETGALPRPTPTTRAAGFSLHYDPDARWLRTARADGDEPAPPGAEEVLAALGAAARPGSYVGLLSWLPESLRPRLEELRRDLRAATGVPVTLQHGPRYLHSTGQLHKGGPAEGVFLLLTHGDEATLPIPDRDHGFEVLHRAQALGDWEALLARERPIVRVDLESPADENLERLRETLRRTGAGVVAAPAG